MSYWDQTREESMPLPPLTDLGEMPNPLGLAMLMLFYGVTVGALLGWIACRWLG